ncbi:MAG: aldehyde dehydrogenase family protein, partial [Phaeodactylibacter sp.]|nr:aldehyde dehydrogenase family protein [Phaeodactylibacter sp.]
MSMQVINPATGTQLDRYDTLNAEAINRRIEQAHSAFLSWKQRSFEDRAQHLKRAAAVLRSNKEDYALLMTREMGKPIAAARSEVEKCAWVCDYYA